MATSSQKTSRHPRFVRRVAETMTRQGLIERGDRILVAVSGGPDSVALLSVLHALAPSRHLSLWAAHFNYGLRGAESDADAAFVMRLCERFNLACLCERLTPPKDLCKGRSFQEAARDVRYAALLRLRASLGANKVAVGHTRDDQAETVLMWLLRGTGTTGLSGMPGMRLPIIRPLLTVRRADVLAYLMEQGLDFREDSSNAAPIYLRNRVRHEVLPLLKQFNPGLLDTLARQADILREDDACLERIAAEQSARVGRSGRSNDQSNEWVVDRTGLLALPLAVQRRVVRKAIQHTAGISRGPSFGAVALLIDRIVRGRSGSSARVQGVNVSREYDTIRFERGTVHAVTEEAADSSVALPVPFTISWSLTGQRLQADLAPPSSPSTDTCSLLPATDAMLDADRLTLDLRVRAWKRGDRFQPFGLEGHQKKLQDFFADLKVPRTMRGRIPLVVAPEGLVWVAGHRTDHRFRVTASTRRVLRLTLLDGERREPG